MPSFEFDHVAVALHSIKPALKLYRDGLGGEYLMGGDQGDLALAPAALSGRRQGRAARAARRRLPDQVPRLARRGPSPRHVQDGRHRGSDRAPARSGLRARRRQPLRSALEGGVPATVEVARHADPDRAVLGPGRRREGPAAAGEPRGASGLARPGPGLELTEERRIDGVGHRRLAVDDVEARPPRAGRGPRGRTRPG